MVNCFVSVSQILNNKSNLLSYFQFSKPAADNDNPLEGGPNNIFCKVKYASVALGLSDGKGETKFLKKLLHADIIYI